MDKWIRIHFATIIMTILSFSSTATMIQRDTQSDKLNIFDNGLKLNRNKNVSYVIRDLFLPREYLGCHIRAQLHDIFNVTPGDYNPLQLSPIQCMIACGRRNYPYAGVENGDLCLCSNTTVNRFVPMTMCNVQCSGTGNYPAAEQPSCGALNRVSVYDVRNRITGLQIHHIPPLSIYKKISVTAGVTTGQDAWFSFRSTGGANTVPPRAQKPVSTYIFDRPGKSEVVVEAENKLTGRRSVELPVTVVDSVFRANITCPKAQVFGQEIECTGYIIRGAPHPTIFQFGDGNKEVIYSSMIYGSVGTRSNYRNLQSQLRTTQSTIIIPQTEFPNDAVINGWELQALSVGAVILQVFRPECGSNEIYCRNKHLCLAAGSTCSDHNEWNCKDDEYFCFIQEKCVSSVDSKSSCEDNSDYKFNSAPADYRLIDQFRYEIVKRGHNIFSLDRPMYAKKGDIIGWTTAGGEIDYSAINYNNEAPEFSYKPDDTLGFVFKRDSEPVLGNWKHIVSALYVVPSPFYLRHKYEATGAYHIISNGTSPTLIYIDSIIEGLTFTCPEYKLTNQLLNVTMATSAGSNVTYQISLDDDTKQTKKIGHFTFSFAKPGVYRLRMLASNMVSSKNDICYIRIYDDITDLKFSAPILAVEMNAMSTISWSVSRATNVTYLIDYGDNTTSTVADYTDMRDYKLEHKYPTYGRFNVTIEATNKIGGRQVIHKVAVVDIAIKGLNAFTKHSHLTENIYLEVNKTPITVEVEIAAGTNVKCQYNFGPFVSPLISDFEYTYTYDTADTYNISIFCENSVSSAEDFVNGTIIVEELRNITGLTVNASRIFFGEEAKIQATIETGSLYFCSWNLGDGTSYDVDRSTFHNVIHHQFTMVDNYIIELKCTNPLGTVSAKYELPVEIPIHGFGISCRKQYVPVNYEYSFYIFTSKGSRLSYRINFGDGNETEFSSTASINRTEVFKHVYRTPGDYQVNVLASNQLDKLGASCPYKLTIENPIEGLEILSNSPLRLLNNLAAFSFDLSPQHKFPTNAKIEWDFGDGTTRVDDLIQPAGGNTRLTTHSYKLPAVYTVKILMRNNITRKNLNIKVDIQKIVPIDMTVKQNVSHVYSQHIIQKNHSCFPLGHWFVINSTAQPKDIQYLFDFGDNSPKSTSMSPSVSHLYKEPGIYTLNVEVQNTLGDFQGMTEIDVQEVIKDMNISVTHFVKLGEIIDVNITAKQYGSRTCGVVDYGDGNVTLINRINCQRFNLKNLGNIVSYESSTRGEPIKIFYEYQTQGFYNVTVFVTNEVSNFTMSKPLQVKYQPCPFPQVFLSSATNISFPRQVKRLNRLVIQCNITLECPVADNVTFAWEIFQNGSDTPLKLRDNYGIRVEDMPFERNPGTLDPSVFKIEHNILPYGLVKVQLKVSYKSRTDNLIEITGKDETWFDVKSSDLEAVIAGEESGISRAVGFGIRIDFNATMSRDPDELEEGQLHFKWYCRRKEEEFDKFFDRISPTNKTAGCFRDGRYFLTSEFGGFKTMNEQGSMISIDTTLMVPSDYVMRVFIKKGQRTGIFDQKFKVKQGDPPPQIDIECRLNCFQMKNPTQALIIRSNCKNCEDQNIFYRWRLYITSEERDGEVVSIPEKEITDLEAKTTTPISGRNMALRENVLKPGMNYILRVAAWRKKSSEALGGFSAFEFSVNRPPYGGYCHVLPTNGVSIQTKFKISCGDWKDESTPLSYSLATFREGVEQNVYTGPEREVEMILPMGEEKYNFTYELVVKIEDKFQFGTGVRLKVRVSEPLKVDFNDVAGNMDKMVSDGDTQALARMALAAGSIMNKGSTSDDKKMSKEEAEAAREKMISSLAKVNPCKLNEIKQMSGVQGEMTKIQEEVTQEAQDKAGGSVDAMASCMAQADAADPSMMETSTSMLSVASNLLGAGTKTQKNVSEVAGKTNADKVLDSVNKVGGALSRQLVAGDKPKKIKTAGMDIEVTQVADESDEEETGFKLPKMSAIYNNSAGGVQGSVGAMVSSMKDNPFKGGAGSDDVKTDVMALSLGSPNGEPMDLKGMEMTMFVKRDLTSDVPPERYEYDVEEGKSLMKIHKFNYTTDVNSIVIEVRPIDENINTEIFISYERRPTISNVVTKYKQITMKEGKGIKPDPFIRVLGPQDLNGTGMYFIGIKLSPTVKEIYNLFEYIPSMNYTLRTWETVCKVWDEDDKKFVTDWCRVGPKTNFNKTQCICVMGGNDTDADEDESADDILTRNRRDVDGAASYGNAVSGFGGNGVIVNGNAPRPTIKVRPVSERPKPKKKKVIKRASFAGGFFVAPNPIDFSKAFAGFSNLAENPIAFATVLSIFGVYLLLLFWARREDRKDVMRAGVTPLAQNHPADKQFYEITVNTGFGAGAATTANVYIRFAGDEGQTEARQLKDDNRKLFQKRANDVFLASYPDFIGDLQYVRIWHDNTGSSPSWNLSSITVHDLNADHKYMFINENIIAVEEGDGSLERVIAVAGADEIKSFNHLFFSTTQKNITDSHIWFSIFIRPPKSRFTRCQRLSCCLTLLYCTMVTNAMFYEVGGPADPASTLQLGPLQFNKAQIGIGIITSLIIFPVNFLIVGVFRAIGPKPTAEEMAKKKENKWWCIREFFFCCPQKPKNGFIDIITEKSQGSTTRCQSYDTLNESITLEGSEIGIKMETEAQEKQREERAAKAKKQKKKLPHWMKYFAWTLLVLVSFTAAFFVVLYGFQFGADKSAQWLSSLFVTFFQDVCVSQPLKIIGLALFIAMIIKKPPEDDDEEESGASKKPQYDEEYLSNKPADGVNKEREVKEPAQLIRFKPPSKTKVQALRAQRLKELKMYNLIREMVIYVLFVVALCQVTYSQMDPSSYNVYRSMEDSFVNGAYGGSTALTDVDSIPKLWAWLNETVIAGLYSTHWYNGEAKDPGFLGDMYANLFGGSRIRQLRVENASCKVEPRFKNKIQDCHAAYSWTAEETGLYNRGWQPITNESLTNPPTDYRAWQYQTAAELDTYPFVGNDVVYRGGGYVAELGKDPRTSHRVIQNLYDNMWMDAQTRALFLEITVYNAQVNLFAIMNFIVEFYPTNGALQYHSIKIAKLYTFGGSAASWSIACQFFVLIFFFIFMYKEGKKIYREKRAYFKGFWNLVEFCMIILVISSIGVFGSRLMLVNKAVKKISDNPGAFVSFNKVVQWDMLFGALTSMVVFLACLKAIKLLQYNQTIALLASTLKGSAKPLAAFSIVFLVFYLAFTTFAYLLFNTTLSDYKNFMTATESVMSLLLGSFSFGEIEQMQPVLGPIWFVLIMLFGVMYIMNVFLSIIMETYASVREDLAMQEQEFELVEFMVGKFMHVFGKGDKKGMGALGKKGAGGKVKVESAAEKEFRERRQYIIAKREKYNEKIHNEIEMKFAQLDDSLNDYFIENFELDEGYKSEGNDYYPHESRANSARTHHTSNSAHNYTSSGARSKTKSHKSDLFSNAPHENSLYGDDLHGVANPSFDFNQMADDGDMKRDLQAELAKWQ